MNLKQLSNKVNSIYFIDSPSFKVIASKQKELLAIMGASTSINKISTIEIENYIQTLKDKGNKPATINSKLMYLSKLLTYALRAGLIQSKPYIPIMKIKAFKEVYLTPADIDFMAQWALQNNFQELYQVIIIGYNSGMRISNILSILEEDIDNNYIRIWENKTNKPYSIPMNTALQELFKNYKPFTLNYRQIQYQWTQMIKALNMDKRITIHTLRHSTCAKLVKEGIALPVVQAIMNHKNIQTTMRYNHLSNKQLENAVCML